MAKNIIPIIMCGGSGSRLWPLSRSSFPKQYLNLDENNKYSLLQNTYLRLKGIKNVHIIDSSVLPTIAAPTVTYSTMANAYRIASNIILDDN